MHINTSKLTWVRQSRSFVAEASDLHSCDEPHRIYQDAADIGLVLVSAETGREATYVMNLEPNKDAEGEIVSWEFQVTPETVRKLPQLRDTKVIIYND